MAAGLADDLAARAPCREADLVTIRVEAEKVCDGDEPRPCRQFACKTISESASLAASAGGVHQGWRLYRNQGPRRRKGTRCHPALAHTHESPRQAPLSGPGR